MNWTEKEIKDYRPIEYAPLTKLYEDANLPANNPEARAEYLVKQVLNLCTLDYNIFMNVAGKDGKASALNLLELLTEQEHKKLMEVNKKEFPIPVPIKYCQR